MQGYNNLSNKYNGDFYVVCPRCKNVVAGKFCNHCGLNLAENIIVSNQAQQNSAPQPTMTAPMPAKPNKKSVIIPVTITLCVLFIAAAILLGAFVIKSASDNPVTLPDNSVSAPVDGYTAGGVSAQEYSKLKVGMSYAQVSAIIGGDGTLVDNGTDIHNQTYYKYCWIGENNSNAYVYITFTNDAVSDIAVDGNL